jgi:transposase
MSLESGRRFIRVLIATDVEAENQDRAVAVDLGIRTFACGDRVSILFVSLLLWKILLKGSVQTWLR